MLRRKLSNSIEIEFVCRKIFIARHKISAMGCLAPNEKNAHRVAEKQTAKLEPGPYPTVVLVVIVTVATFGKTLAIQTRLNAVTGGSERSCVPAAQRIRRYVACLPIPSSGKGRAHIEREGFQS